MSADPTPLTLNLSAIFRPDQVTTTVVGLAGVVSLGGVSLASFDRETFVVLAQACRRAVELMDHRLVGE